MHRSGESNEKTGARFSNERVIRCGMPRPGCSSSKTGHCSSRVRPSRKKTASRAGCSRRYRGDIRFQGRANGDSLDSTDSGHVRVRVALSACVRNKVAHRGAGGRALRIKLGERARKVRAGKGAARRGHELGLPLAGKSCRRERALRRGSSMRNGSTKRLGRSFYPSFYPVSHQSGASLAHPKPRPPSRGNCCLLLGESDGRLYLDFVVGVFGECTQCRLACPPERPLGSRDDCAPGLDSAVAVTSANENASVIDRPFS
jgi:hypothetical protein